MFKSQSCLILSPPRTGSNFLANFIAKKFYPNHSVIKDPDVLGIISSGQRFIASTHELLSNEQLVNVIPVFNIRENLIESVFSRVIANYYELWKPNGLMWNERMSKPFAARPKEVYEALFQQIEWYSHYRPMLTKYSHVVSYEVFTQLIYNNYEEKIDKSKVIENYASMIDYINSNLTDKARDDHGEFVDWKCRPGRQEIYQILQS